MKDITHKPETRRFARAAALLQVGPEILELTDNGRKTDKGDALQASRVAGIMAVKRASEALPFCHPIPITHCDVFYDLRSDGIYVEVTATTIAATGVEMEALFGASVVAMNLYDMLKPHASTDTGQMAVRDVHLVEKRGGKSDSPFTEGLRAAVLVIHDAVFSGEKEDTAGQALCLQLRNRGVEIASFEVLPLSAAALDAALDELVASEVDLICTIGGTGSQNRGVVVECVQARLDQLLPGVMEAARAHGQRRTPHAMLSGGIAGRIGDKFVVTFPGSTAGAIETAQAILTGILHAASRTC